MAKKKQDGEEPESGNTVTIVGGKAPVSEPPPKTPPERMKLAEYQARTGLKAGVARGLLLLEGDAARTIAEWEALVKAFRSKPTSVPWAEWKRSPGSTGA
jgi:hypothetical protein